MRCAFHFRNWVMKGHSAAGEPLSDDRDGRRWWIRTKGAMGFPEHPGSPGSTNPDAPNSFIMPMLDYDWGPDFDYSENIGVPRLRAAGDQAGDATKGARTWTPTATSSAAFRWCCGWRRSARTSAGTSPPRASTQGRSATTRAAWIPFAQDEGGALANGDPRLSLEERYRNHAGYVRAVKIAASKVFAEGFLLAADRDALIQAAEASSVLQ